MSSVLIYFACFLSSVFPYSSKSEKFPHFKLARNSGESNLFKKIILFSWAHRDLKCFVLDFRIVFYFQNDLGIYHCQVEIHLIEGEYSTQYYFWKSVFLCSRDGGLTVLFAIVWVILKNGFWTLTLPSTHVALVMFKSVLFFFNSHLFILQISFSFVLKKFCWEC